MSLGKIQRILHVPACKWVAVLCPEKSRLPGAGGTWDRGNSPQCHSFGPKRAAFRAKLHQEKVLVGNDTTNIILVQKK